MEAITGNYYLTGAELDDIETLYYDSDMEIDDSMQYPDYKWEKINLLWLVPIIQQEKEFIEEKRVDEYLKDKDLSRIHILEN